MNSPITTWLLAGALAASLAWNARDWIQTSPPPEPRACATPDFAKLDLRTEQKDALARWCASNCEQACAAENDAQATLQELHAVLRDPSATPDRVRALAEQVNRAHAQAVDACVESILEVRRVLTQQQLEHLMDCCGVAPKPGVGELKRLGYTNR